MTLEGFDSIFPKIICKMVCIYETDSFVGGEVHNIDTPNNAWHIAGNQQIPEEAGKRGRQEVHQFLVGVKIQRKLRTTIWGWQYTSKYPRMEI